MIKVNITNTYRIDTAPQRDNDKRLKEEQRRLGKVGAMVERKMVQLEAEADAGKLLHHSDDRTAAAAEKRFMETTIPADSDKYRSSFNIKTAESRDDREANRAAALDPANSPADHPDSEKPEFVEQRQSIKAADRRESDDQRLARAKEHADLEQDSYRSTEALEPEHIDLLSEQRGSRSVLEEFLEKMLAQSRNQQSIYNERVDGQLEASANAHAETAEMLDQQEALERDATLGAVDALHQREQARDDRDEAMLAVHKKIHQAYLEQLDERMRGSQKVVAALEINEHQVEPAQELRQQAASAATPAGQLVLPEDYARRLSEALESYQSESSQRVPLVALQREGVFGLSSAGRNLSITDFIRQKEFEYNLDQRPFTVDDFLHETENAIYETLNNGNSSSVAGTLLQAAEAVNSFRNHMIRAAEVPDTVPVESAMQEEPAAHPWQDDEQ